MSSSSAANVAGYLGPRCCACDDVSKALAFNGKAGETSELVRGLTYLGSGKWLCVTCAKKANAGFAYDVREHFVKLSKPPEGYV